MTPETKKTSGVVLITVPSITYGGYFLLSVLNGYHDHLQLTEFQKAMFRAGHAHAGVLVIFSLVAFLYIDMAKLSVFWKMCVRISFPLSAILISGGFFAAASEPGATQSNQLILILYTGIVALVVGVSTLGIGLLKK
ncbi:MAG TPA: hypothetical protein VL947_03020 [Cytophagales bacterium]|nr:hypothetical protein [Cytophagales bacterium]